MSDRDPIRRREFLKLFSFAPAVIIAAKDLTFEKLLWSTQPLPSQDVTPSKIPDPTALEDVTSRVFAQLCADLGPWYGFCRYYAHPRGYRMGDAVPVAAPVGRGGLEVRPVVLDSMLAVDLNDQELKTPTDVQRQISAIAASFASRIVESHSDIVAGLSFPMTCSFEFAEVHNGRLGLRACRAYDVLTDRMRVRFDMLFGQSPEAKRDAERGRQRRLADTIRRRLAQPRRPIPRLDI